PPLSSPLTLDNGRQMPLPAGIEIRAIPDLIPQKITDYNQGPDGPSYNEAYSQYIAERNTGIAAGGSLSAWVTSGNAVGLIQELLIAYGMNARNSQLVSPPAFQAVIEGLIGASLDWINSFALPLPMAPVALMNPQTGLSLSNELTNIYNTLSSPGSVTVSGGFVAASKAAHCLFPNLAPMIDGAHTGISYYNIARVTYTPPLGIVNWVGWIGHQIAGVPNPSPRGAGRRSWGADQFLAAIGVNQHIYEMWYVANGNPGLQAFLKLDPVHGTAGIPRIIDKVLW
ncbi:MAG: hypothetical protein KAT29_11165, partial [Anaerolineales bacterium]|nr:hypothetical protein [Anaerolineales bacterium]